MEEWKQALFENSVFLKPGPQRRVEAGDRPARALQGLIGTLAGSSLTVDRPKYLDPNPTDRGSPLGMWVD